MVVASSRPLRDDRISLALSGRDWALIALFLLVNVAVVVAVVLLTGSDDDDSESKKAKAPPRPGASVVHRRIGARISKPIGWAESRRGRSLILRSPDDTTIMSISQPPDAINNREVLRSAVAAIGRQYKKVAVRPLRGKIARLPTVSRVVSATNRRGVRVNVLVASPQGRGRTWLVEVFSGPGARAKRLPEAQVALGTLRLSG